ncbi:MAG: hypothetical protein JWR15_1125 [Prosthecobacter sp.]|nr:hypothetical protein [Prosthecobacter sp.]
MTTSATQNENLRMYVNDTAAMAKHIEEAFDRQRKDEEVRSHIAAHQLIESMHSILAAQRVEMDRQAHELGGGVGAVVKEAVTTLAGSLAGLYGKVRKHPLSRILRDNYMALSLACVAYEMLHTTALGMGQKGLASVALRHLTELTPLIMAVTRIIPEVVLMELAKDDASIDVSVAKQALENTLGAWCSASPQE